jgi:thiamine-monophosphate kinase
MDVGMGEQARIERLAEIFGNQGLVLGEVGIGDDAAALITAGGERLVWTVDAQVENVHFRRAWLSYEDLGYRSIVAAASDISAMGGAPWRALSALTLSSEVTDDDTFALARGQKEAADRVGVSVVGGNLSKADMVTVTTTVLGSAKRPLTRSGATVGDGVWVAGALGLAAAGLRALEAGSSDPSVDGAIQAWRRPSPRVAEGLAMSASAHAAIDISDGLALDVSRIADASGVAAVLDRRLLFAAAGDSLTRAASTLGADALDLILGGGEDYALVATSELPIAGFTRVGEIREGRGVFLRSEHGEERLRDLLGFDHFR